MSHNDDAKAVLNVEMHDYTALAPTDRPRAQGLRGFDPIYTDIVDYIVRCTHRIWDERNVGLIYTHYAHNAVVYGTMGTIRSREELVQDTIQTIAQHPDRRGLASQVIWGGNEDDGFYTSHLVTSVGRHIGPGPYGPPTGKRFYYRTFADCMIFENRIFREWIVRDTVALLHCIGADVDAVAAGLADGLAARGVKPPMQSDTGRLLGQMPPADLPDLSIAHNDDEAACLTWLHDAWNRRMFGVLRDVYAPNVVWHGFALRDVHGQAAALHQTIALLAMIPDGSWIAHHICSVPCNEGGHKIAVRWTLEGHHLGWGVLGAPTSKPLFVMGMSHFHVVGGRVIEEWTLIDELALRVQIRLVG